MTHHTSSQTPLSGMRVAVSCRGRQGPRVLGDRDAPPRGGCRGDLRWHDTRHGPRQERARGARRRPRRRGRRFRVRRARHPGRLAARQATPLRRGHEPGPRDPRCRQADRDHLPRRLGRDLGGDHRGGPSGHGFDSGSRTISSTRARAGSTSRPSATGRSCGAASSRTSRTSSANSSSFSPSAMRR